MPKARMTTVERCDRALRQAVARCKVDARLEKDWEVAEKLGIAPSTYSNRKESMYRTYGFEKAGAFARTLGMTGREVCAIMGVPYDDPQNN